MLNWGYKVPQSVGFICLEINYVRWWRDIKSGVYSTYTSLSQYSLMYVNKIKNPQFKPKMVQVS